MFATALALLAQEFQGRERGTAFGIWGATIAASAAIGPLLGGALTEGFGWASIFYINVPIGIVGGGADDDQGRASRAIPRASGSTGSGRSRSPAALFLLVFAIIRGNADGWDERDDRGAVRGVGGAAGRCSWSRSSSRRTRCSTCRCSASRRSAAPSSARSRCPRRCSRCSCTSTLYIQTLLGFSPLQTGPALPAVHGRLVLRRGRVGQPVRRGFRSGSCSAAGSLLVGVGLLLMRGLTAASHWTALLAGFIVAGAGVG